MIKEPEVQLDPEYNPFNTGGGSSSASGGSAGSGGGTRVVPSKLNRDDWNQLYEGLDAEPEVEVQKGWRRVEGAEEEGRLRHQVGRRRL